jgi:type II secretory pathway pseudopilin PulG
MSARFVADDSGMSMVELIVAAAISAMLLGLLASIFGGSLIAQQQGAERNGATMQLNAATTSITESVRSSTAVRASAGGLRLDAKALSADGTTWECRAWEILDGELRYSAGVSTRSAATTDWASLALGVSGSIGTGAAPKPAFEQDGKRVTVGLEITQGETTVAVQDGSVAQVVQTGGPSCW